MDIANESVQLLEQLKMEKSNADNVDDDIVDPWTVASSCDSGVNYDKLIGNCFYFASSEPIPIII